MQKVSSQNCKQLGYCCDLQRVTEYVFRKTHTWLNDVPTTHAADIFGFDEESLPDDTVFMCGFQGDWSVFVLLSLADKDLALVV